MFDGLQNQFSNQKNKPPLGPQPPIALKEDISQRIKGLEEQGRKQDKKKTIYSAIGIVVILLFVGGIITAGYYFWPEITVGFNELIGKSEVTNDIVVNNNSENETAENQDNYYQELIKGCEKFKGSVMTTDYDCCIQTVEIMQKNNFRLAPEDGCSNETEINSLLCAGAYNWCEPVKKVEGIDEKEMDITNWQIYRNEEYGLQFQYPVETGGGTTEIIENKNIIYLVPKNNLHYQEIQENIKSDKSDFEKVSGISWAFLIKQVNNGEELLNVIKLRYGLGCNIEKIMSKNQVDVYDIIIKKDGKTPEEGSQCFINYKVITKYYFNENKVVLWSMGQDCTFFIQNEDGSECYDDEIADTFKFLKDTDNDGLFDDEEPQYGTDLNNPDSDGDGYFDGDEVKNGYNPIGSGELIKTLDTPESVLITSVNGIADCDLDLYVNKIYFSDEFIKQYKLWSELVNSESLRWEDLKSKIKKDVSDKIPINKINNIDIINQKIINNEHVKLSYIIDYIPDDNGITPIIEEKEVYFIKINNEWLFDAESMLNNEMSSENIKRQVRDGSRISDIKEIQTVLELYYNDFGYYPASLPFGQLLSENNFTYPLAIPENPTPNDGNCAKDFMYTYIQENNGQSYSLTYCLGELTAGIPAGYNIASPSGTTNQKISEVSYKQCEFKIR